MRANPSRSHTTRLELRFEYKVSNWKLANFWDLAFVKKTLTQVQLYLEIIIPLYLKYSFYFIQKETNVVCATKS
jgi:hypothetical protein